ncbi:hypothetical protein ATK36_0300 [Amycolatopsis sulphurea]|uniref:Uncharacterized protein n=1 Tax=Amycolatopsis sulphurea TaxID=76022 RepID=A0A2A9G1F1_9PSEU|nr:hypothetical protein [Amycolatopsis sulphurea]PFG56776.1 hypothetical protein ATK36_0300 [Amycolatopsis sulphurea]
MVEASTARWYLVGALPEEHPVAHLMTRSDDLRYRRSACGARDSRSWTPIDLTAPGTGHLSPCPACAATLSGAPVPSGELEQLAFDLQLG